MTSMRYLYNRHHAIAFQTNNVEKYLLYDDHDVERLSRLQSADKWFKVLHGGIEYRQVSNIRRTKSQHLKDSRTVLRLSLPNPLKPDVKPRMKMKLEQRRQAMLQLRLIDRQFYCLPRCVLY